MEREWTGTRDRYLGDPQLCALAGEDGLVLAFEQSSGGRGWRSASLRLFELGDSLREITPRLPDGWYPKELKDLDRDGRKELLVTVDGAEFGASHGLTASPGCRRVYRWDRENDRFADASARFPGFHLGSIRKGRAQMAAALAAR